MARRYNYELMQFPNILVWNGKSWVSWLDWVFGIQKRPVQVGEVQENGLEN